MKTISVTRALVELKRFDERITRAISEGKYVGVQMGTNSSAKVYKSQDTITAMQEKIRASFQKVEALIENRTALKRAIVMSNATTDVEIFGKVMKVAEAIEMKSTISQRQAFLNNMSSSFVTSRNLVDKENAALEDRINKLLETSYGGDKSKIDAAAYEVISKPQREMNSLSLIDPVGIEKKIDEQRDMVQNMVSEIDFALSESNARTVIEVMLD
jgi:hypothetical protein